MTRPATDMSPAAVAAVLPGEAAGASWTTPALMVRLPLKVLLPVRMRVPAPALVKALPRAVFVSGWPEITPLIVAVAPESVVMTRVWALASPFLFMNSGTETLEVPVPKLITSV